MQRPLPIVNHDQDHPDLVRDQFWDEQYPELPYTAAAEETKCVVDPCVGSTANVEVKPEITQSLTSWTSGTRLGGRFLKFLVTICFLKLPKYMTFWATLNRPFLGK